MIRIENLYKSFQSKKVLYDINLNINKGEIISIIGPSGSGKSTLLRTINFLEEPTSGSIYYYDNKITKNNIYDIRKKIGMVFQNYNLFPHKTVLENIILAPTIVKNEDISKSKKEAMILLEQMNLAHKKDVYPNSLSGGEKQRIAIARSLIMKPELMLFDEVTSALDPEMVCEVLDVIKNLCKNNMTIILVTHEMAFAKTISTKTIFMADGKIVEVNTPKELFENPKEKRTREFLSKVLYY